DCTLEDILCENCDSDTEVISVKSSTNILRRITLRNNSGSLVLRHANDCQVSQIWCEGQSGIRIYGHGHKIWDVVGIKNRGNDLRRTIVLGQGSAANEPTNGQHAQCRDIDIANITIYNEGFAPNHGTDADPQDSMIEIGNPTQGGASIYDPQDIRFANIIVQ